MLRSVSHTTHAVRLLVILNARCTRIPRTRAPSAGHGTAMLVLLDSGSLNPVPSCPPASTPSRHLRCHCIRLLRWIVESYTRSRSRSGTDTVSLLFGAHGQVGVGLTCWVVQLSILATGGTQSSTCHSSTCNATRCESCTAATSSTGADVGIAVAALHSSDCVAFVASTSNAPNDQRPEEDECDDACRNGNAVLFGGSCRDAAATTTSAASASTSGRIVGTRVARTIPHV